MENTVKTVKSRTSISTNLDILWVRIGHPIRSSHLDNGDLNQLYMELEIWRMPQLRDLSLIDGVLPDPCKEISSLENLHTLSRIKYFKCSKRILEMIPNLKKLGIIYSVWSTFERGYSEYGLCNLVHLNKLENLRLYSDPFPNRTDLSRNISFPIALKKLSLSGCRFPWEGMSMIGALPNLQMLKLMRAACHGTEWETNEGELCQLKVLVIDISDLHEWIAESSSFAKLERLTLYECDHLRDMPNGSGDIPTLQLIEVDIRNLSVVKSAKFIEEEHQSFGNDLLQVRILKSRSWKNLES